jgi:hypothetical protein
VFDGYSFKGCQSVIISGGEEFSDVTNTGHERVDEVVHLGSDIEAANKALDLYMDQEQEVGPSRASSSVGSISKNALSKFGAFF